MRVADADNCVVLCDKCAALCNEDAITFPDKGRDARVASAAYPRAAGAGRDGGTGQLNSRRDDQ